jgi:hypothetical protein
VRGAASRAYEYHKSLRDVLSGGKKGMYLNKRFVCVTAEPNSTEFKRLLVTLGRPEYVYANTLGIDGPKPRKARAEKPAIPMFPKIDSGGYVTGYSVPVVTPALFIRTLHGSPINSRYTFRSAGLIGKALGMPVYVVGASHPSNAKIMAKIPNFKPLPDAVIEALGNNPYNQLLDDPYVGCSFSGLGGFASSKDVLYSLLIWGHEEIGPGIQHLIGKDAEDIKAEGEYIAHKLHGVDLKRLKEVAHLKKIGSTWSPTHPREEKEKTVKVLQADRLIAALETTVRESHASFVWGPELMGVARSVTAYVEIVGNLAKAGKTTFPSC